MNQPDPRAIKLVAKWKRAKAAVGLDPHVAKFPSNKTREVIAAMRRETLKARADAEAAAKGVLSGAVLCDEPPPPQQKPRRKRCRKGSIDSKARRRAKRAMGKAGGARLIKNKVPSLGGGQNSRTCLPEAVSALLPANNKEQLVNRMLEAMPAVGDTPVRAIAEVLAAHGLFLKAVSGEFCKKGGYPFNLLQKRACRLVLQLRLVDHNKDQMKHFIAWNGEVLIDLPQCCWIYDDDRSTQERSNLAFSKLYPKSQFSIWSIEAVYSLE